MGVPSPDSGLMTGSHDSILASGEGIFSATASRRGIPFVVHGITLSEADNEDGKATSPAPIIFRIGRLIGNAGRRLPLARSRAFASAGKSCSRSSRPARGRVPTTAPSSVLWDKSAKGIKLKYPADWQPKKNPDYELMLLPAGASKDDRRITVDIPDLPPHLPFMIQMGRVEHDYVQDLKKDHPDLQVQDSVAVKMPESTAKLVRSQWHQNGTVYHDVAPVNHPRQRRLHRRCRDWRGRPASNPVGVRLDDRVHCLDKASVTGAAHPPARWPNFPRGWSGSRCIFLPGPRRGCRPSFRWW